MLMQNNLLNSASRLLGSLGMRGAVQELNQARVPVGIATTVASAVEGNPRAARGLLGSVAPELNSPVLNTAMRIGGIGAMMSMFQSLGPMLSGMFGGIGGAGGIFGSLSNSSGLAVMSNGADNSLARSFMNMGGVDPMRTQVVSVDPGSGATSRWGAGAAAQATYERNVANMESVQRMTAAAVPHL